MELRQAFVLDRHTSGSFIPARSSRRYNRLDYDSIGFDIRVRLIVELLAAFQTIDKHMADCVNGLKYSIFTAKKGRTGGMQ